MNNHLEENLKNVPGGVALIVLDDLLTVLHGTDTFCSLIQNIRSKSNLKFPLALLRVVYSADIIYVTQQLAQQRQREDGMFRINFRILQDDGHFKWVMISGNKTMEEYTLVISISGIFLYCHGCFGSYDGLQTSRANGGILSSYIRIIKGFIF